MSSDRDKQVEKVANFIINNIGFATSINLLVQKARETAEIIVDNDYEKEDFELYLNTDQSEKNFLLPEQKEVKKSGVLSKWMPFEFCKKFPFIKRITRRSGFSTRG